MPGELSEVKGAYLATRLSREEYESKIKEDVQYLWDEKETETVALAQYVMRQCAGDYQDEQKTKENWKKIKHNLKSFEAEYTDAIKEFEADVSGPDSYTKYYLSAFENVDVANLPEAKKDAAEVRAKIKQIRDVLFNACKQNLPNKDWSHLDDFA